MKTRPRHAGRKSSRARSLRAPSSKPREPFAVRIHPRLRPVFERIQVPEPQPFKPDRFQVEALEKLESGDVLVTAPTGSGKTYIAVKAIEQVHGLGRRSWYASPLKALSNAKYEEFCALFGESQVGILTGDRKENTQAPIIVGTTEILRNQLYDTMHRGEDLSVDLVVIDEAHYLGDEDRGVVWEEVFIYLPPRVRLLLLSATIRNAGELCGWLEWLRKSPCRWVNGDERPVPLFPLFLFPQGELTPLGSKRGLFPKIRTMDPRSFSRGGFADIGKLMTVLRQANLLPAIFFLKSRADCEKAITLCPAAGRNAGRNAAGGFVQRLDDILALHPFLRGHQHMAMLRRARVGAHHGGQLPQWKLLLEKLMQDGYLEAIFATSTVAAGVNFPARTVVVLQSDRFNGRDFVDLSSTDLLQMTGRAGRRGKDEIGFVLVVPGRHQDPQLIHDLLRAPPEPIASQLRINFSMVLNLLLSHAPEEIRGLIACSLATFQNVEKGTEIAREAGAIREQLAEWAPEMACEDLESLARIRPQYAILDEQVRKTRKRWRHQAAQWSLEALLEPGRTFVNRRGTPYVVVTPGSGEVQAVEAVRLTFPLRHRKGRVATREVRLHRVQQLGGKLDELPRLSNRAGWEALISRVAARGLEQFGPGGQTEREQPPVLKGTMDTLTDVTMRKASLPCGGCALFGPCQKSTNHPFSRFLQRYFDHLSRVRTVQEQLWRSFQVHFRFLQGERYVDEQGRLTVDGLWASKLRLDQPLLISEGIRKSVFPMDDAPLLAALIAPFVMDRERATMTDSSALAWKFPDLAKPFIDLMESLRPLAERLQTAGFHVPPLAFWAVATVYHWALGMAWEEVRAISGSDEGDLAMLILRTADHLRQIESLADTHPNLAATARRGIELILREPVLMN